MQTQGDNRSLILRIAEWDEEAATIFEQTYKPRLLRCAWRQGIPDEDCQDLAQEVFLTAIEQIRANRFRGESSLGTWLQGILMHKVNDHRRTRHREGPQVSADDQDWASGPPAVVPRMEDVLEVREVLEGLPGDRRAILLLNQTEGWTIEEIAQKLGMNRGTVGRKLAEAKAMFRCAISRLREPRLPPRPEMKVLPSPTD